MSVCLYAWYEQQSENRNFFNPYSHIYFEVYFITKYAIVLI